jgi:hypothetical protein
MTEDVDLLQPSRYDSVNLDLVDSAYLYDLFYKENPGYPKVPLERYPNDPENNRWVFPYPWDIWDAWFNEGIDPNDEKNYIAPPVEGITWGYTPNPSKPNGLIYPKKYERLWFFVHDPQRYLYPRSTGVVRTAFPRYTPEGTLPLSGIFPSLCPPYLPDIKTSPPYAAWQHAISLRNTDIVPGFLNHGDVPAQRLEVTLAFDGSTIEDTLQQYTFSPSVVPRRIPLVRPDYSRLKPSPNDTSYMPMPYGDFVIHAASARKTNGWYAFYRQRVVRSRSFNFPSSPAVFKSLIAIRRALFNAITGGVYGFNNIAIRNAVYKEMQADVNTYFGGSGGFVGEVSSLIPPKNPSPAQQFALDKLKNMETLVRLSFVSVMYELEVDDKGAPVFEIMPYKVVIVNAHMPSSVPTVIKRTFYSFPDPIELTVPPFLDQVTIGRLDRERNIRNIDWVPKGASAGFLRFSYRRGSSHHLEAEVEYPGQYKIDARVVLSVQGRGIELLRYVFLLTIEKLSVIHAEIDYEAIERVIQKVSFPQIDSDSIEQFGIPEKYRRDPSTLIVTDFSYPALAGIIRHDDPASYHRTKQFMNKKEAEFNFTRTLGPVPAAISNIVTKTVYHTPSSTYMDVAITSMLPFRIVRKYSAPFYPTLMLYSFNPVIVKVYYFGERVKLEPHAPRLPGYTVASRIYREDGAYLLSSYLVVTDPRILGDYRATLIAQRGDEAPIKVDIITYRVEMFNGIPKHRMFFSKLYAEGDGTDRRDPPFLRALCRVYARDHGIDLVGYIGYYLMLGEYASVTDKFLACAAFPSKKRKGKGRVRIIDDRTQLAPHAVPLELPFLCTDDHSAAFDPFDKKWRAIPGGKEVPLEEIFYRPLEREHMGMLAYFMKLMSEAYLNIAHAYQDASPPPPMPRAIPFSELPRELVTAVYQEEEPAQPVIYPVARYIPDVVAIEENPFEQPTPGPDSFSEIDFPPYPELPPPSPLVLPDWTEEVPLFDAPSSPPVEPPSFTWTEGVPSFDQSPPAVKPLLPPSSDKDIPPLDSLPSPVIEPSSSTWEEIVSPLDASTRPTEPTLTPWTEDIPSLRDTPTRTDVAPPQQRDVVPHKGGVSEMLLTQRIYLDSYINHLLNVERACASCSLEQLGKNPGVYLSSLNKALMASFREEREEDDPYKHLEALTGIKAGVHAIARDGMNAKFRTSIFSKLYEIGPPEKAVVEAYHARRSIPYYTSAGTSPYPIQWTTVTRLSFLDMNPVRAKFEGFSKNAKNLFTTETGLVSVRKFFGKDFYADIERTENVVALQNHVAHLVDVTMGMDLPVGNPFCACLLSYCALRKHALSTIPNIAQLISVSSAYKEWYDLRVAPFKVDIKKTILSLLEEEPNIDWFLSTAEAYRFSVVSTKATMWPFFRHGRRAFKSLLDIITSYLTSSLVDDTTLCDLLSIVFPEVALVWVPEKPWRELKKILFDLIVPDSVDLVVPATAKGGYDVYNTGILLQYILVRHLGRALLAVASIKSSIIGECISASSARTP